MMVRLEAWPNQFPMTATTQGHPANWTPPLATCAATKKTTDQQDQEFVALHNAARREVGVEDVVWDETAVRYARAYAAVRAADCGLTHTDQATRDSLGYGENIMVGAPGSDLTVAETVQTWCIGRPEELRCGHYTQVVGRDTKAIGCARAKCVNGGVFINCYYTPAGNVLNQRPF
ncbi:pathogenesis-related protein PR-1 type-like [Miscanthus floridulus]|uniref:pathogenesis-related protein PR-1 type-like n=1 Tax=Miscanthus floridulus TaxID=154761 RepID=UPI0034595F36